MERTAPLGRLTWHVAKLVDSIVETPRVRTLAFDIAEWPGHLPGQHVDLRLTAPDGYQAVRSYSIASAPGSKRVELTVERLPEGEVSPYLVDVLRPGDQVELRGPIGGYFVWKVESAEPVLLVGGGSGIVPLMAMARHHGALKSSTPMRLLFSCRSPEDAIYHKELTALRGRGFEPFLTFTRSQAGEGFHRRVDAEMLREVGWKDMGATQAMVCGPTGFVEAVSATLVELGYAPEKIKTERFGPTGG